MENKNPDYFAEPRCVYDKDNDSLPIEEQLKKQDELVAVRDRIEDMLKELEDGGFDFDAVLVSMAAVLHLMVKSATDRDLSIILHRDTDDNLHVLPIAQEIIHRLIGDVIADRRGAIDRLFRSDGTTRHNPL